ncbi:substrate-binding periplasmic protein [Desulfovibrio ferrophilus]|uniref:Uncharacterized protein n=1 Tax=Desulfovibrio ferrophilus TaxID=241368 RepID=A0A2Z6B189_9BACT|nr:transporter substrate-binding domain-containing protein [Desulfovibrio ferrophilus]BBD09190.1 uncharacterized protein DFE_2464 [Desulfovibrio ferrophilus]
MAARVCHQGWLVVIACVLFINPVGCAYALDEIVLTPGFSAQDDRYAYPYAILKRALESTVVTDGGYTISYSPSAMSRKRALEELVQGKLLNVHIAATRPEWESEVLPVRIPVLKGLLGYRLFLVRCDSLTKFEHVQSLAELKSLRVGSGAQWTTTEVLRKAGFNVVAGTDYEGLFGMLDIGRFDYIPRGVNEIFLELNSRKERYPGLCVEPSLMLYFPTPSYFFVSPHFPKLAARIERGMERIIQSGEMDLIFEEYYGEAIARAELKRRMALTIDNDLLSRETPFDRHELWYRP